MSQGKRANRLERLLALIPFLQKNNGIALSDAASLFEVSEEQLMADLNLIWVCGLPGYSHLELIDVSYDSGTITIDNAETLSRPMRLTFDEVTTLLLAIETLLEIAPSTDVEVLIEVRDKLLKLLDMPVDTQSSLMRGSREVEDAKHQSLLPKLLGLLETGAEALLIDYYSATLDDIIRYRVRPISLDHRQGKSYLLAYRVEEEEHLNLRLDRIVRVVDAPPGRGEEPLDGHEPGSALKEAPVTVEVSVDSSAYWFIQKWRLPDLRFNQKLGGFVGTITVFNPKWLERATLSAAGALRLIHPSELRSQAVDAAQRALSNYE